MPTLDVIIPARDLHEHVSRCVELIGPQLRPGDRVVVVDDGSREPIVATGATVVRTERAEGPYVARHRAATDSSRDVLVFVDARCRPRPGLLDAHRALHADGATALSCTGVEIVGDSLAARVARIQDLFGIDKLARPAARLPYFPTANLGVNRRAYDRVGGFRVMRSGGDADLCWRIQNRGLGSMGIDDRVLMQWVPRTSVTALAGQWIRYGQSSWLLEHLYPATLSPFTRRASRRAETVRMIKATAADPRQAPALAIAGAMHALFTSSYLLAKRHPVEEPAYITQPQEEAA